MTQIAMNNKISNIIKISSYFVNHERESNLFERKLKHISANSVINRVKRLKNIKENIQKMHFKSKKYINKKRKKGPQLKEKNKVYLLTKNLTTKKSTKKLNYTKIESFFIKAVKRSVSYELSLSKNIRIHSIFHINLLKLADFSTFIQKDFHFEDSNEEYTVEEILEKKGQKYLINWKRYSHSNNTWEPLKNLTNCKKLFQQFHQHSKDYSTKQTSFR